MVQDNNLLVRMGTIHKSVTSQANKQCIFYKCVCARMCTRAHVCVSVHEYDISTCLNKCVCPCECMWQEVDFGCPDLLLSTLLF